MGLCSGRVTAEARGLIVGMSRVCHADTQGTGPAYFNIETVKRRPRGSCISDLSTTQRTGRGVVINGIRQRYSFGAPIAWTSGLLGGFPCWRAFLFCWFREFLRLWLFRVCISIHINGSLWNPFVIVLG